jgi:tRNA uridine 5-carboxymethylaminomethyl modification enzyme
MPCNPSIGGLGKGHIIYEISALGGLMPKLCTQSYLQARMLNTSKGPAVQGLRLQIDKYKYSQCAHKILCEMPNLSIIDDMALELICELTAGAGAHKRVTGVKTLSGEIFNAPCIVITAGTFLNGLMHVGRVRFRAGRRGEHSVPDLSQSIGKAMGVSVGRLKTGTPPRLLRSSINFSALEKQENHLLDYLYEFNPVCVQEKIPCYITHTNEKTHEIIKKYLHMSALYSGNIKGVGPRYCPSIEDKIGRYSHQNSHHVFVEPEGEFCDEVYPAGLSTSLPLDVQWAYIQSIKGFERAVITKCGYAIEYDFIQPTNLTHTLETKTVSGLFLAGQINGTTGYEEAAGQGLVAGINAALKVMGRPVFRLDRNESYIGVMIDDLVTLGADEPYRMFTSRAERRLLLRQDNVFTRLMPYGKQLGLVPDELYNKFLCEKNIIQASVNIINTHEQQELFNVFHVIDFTPDIKERAREFLTRVLIENREKLELLCDWDPAQITQGLSSRALLAIHAEVRYAGYLEKERKEIEKAIKYQHLELPDTLDYKKMPGLTVELVQKLSYYRPKSIAQAQLIPGMTPAAISILIFQSRQMTQEYTNESNKSQNCGAKGD